MYPAGRDIARPTALDVMNDSFIAPDDMNGSFMRSSGPASRGF
jgi:hypothetical protein